MDDDGTTINNLIPGAGICVVADCGHPCQGGQLMCFDHWERVPEQQRLDLRTAWARWVEGSMSLNDLRYWQWRCVQAIYGPVEPALGPAHRVGPVERTTTHRVVPCIVDEGQTCTDHEPCQATYDQSISQGVIRDVDRDHLDRTTARPVREIEIPDLENGAIFGDDGRFFGFTERECRVHRTVGGRAWCYDCTEWCTPKAPCARCWQPRLEAELSRLQALFELQQTRMAEATEAWRAESPEERDLTLPDLGDLLTWLMERAGIRYDYGAVAMPGRGVSGIAAERRRQVEKGYTPEHDDEHVGSLALAAHCYLDAGLAAMASGDASTTEVPADWPWEPAAWRPSDNPVRNFAKAGALLAAEIDRLEREARARMGVQES